MKTLWSFTVSLLLSALASGFIVFAVNSPKALFVNLAVGGVGLCFLVAFIHFTRPQDRIAGKLAGVLNVAAGGLLLAALVLWLLQTFAAVG